MAAPKKTVKSAAKAAETAVKVETAAPKAEVENVEVETVPATAEKKEAAPKVPAKRGPAKKTVKKADQKATLHVQFSGKSYSQEELVKMAQDVWKYDLKQKVRELASIDLYVKPEENMVYYVMNQEFTGSFYI